MLPSMPPFVLPSSGGLGGNGVMRRPVAWTDECSSLLGGIPRKTLPGEGDTRILLHADCAPFADPVATVKSRTRTLTDETGSDDRKRPIGPIPHARRWSEHCASQMGRKLASLIARNPQPKEGFLASTGKAPDCKSESVAARPGSNPGESTNLSHGADLREPRCFFFVVSMPRIIVPFFN